MPDDASHEEVVDVVELGQLGGLEDLSCGPGFDRVDPAVAIGRIGIAVWPLGVADSPENIS